MTIGKIRDDSRKIVLGIIDKLSKNGAEAVILGCTELTLLIAQKDTSGLLFDTTELHAKSAVDAAT